jgi:oligo-1,6-glucosidase
MDAFNLFQKTIVFRLPKEIVNKPVEIIKYYGNGPSAEYIQEMNMEVLSKYDMMTVAEGRSSPVEAMKFVNRKELDIAYHFESVDIGNHINDFGLVKYKIF